MLDKHFSTRAIVLMIHPLRESDLILTLLTADYGKLSAIARGARRSKKRFMGGIDLFDCAVFELEAPRNKNQHLFYACSLSEREIWLGLRADLSKVALAAFCLEAANYFIPEGDRDGSELFSPLRLTLSRISFSSTSGDSYVQAIWFALTLLKQGGVNPLADRLSIRPETRTWWEKLLSSPTPAKPDNSKIVSESFVSLFSYVEQTIGHRLQTHSHFLAEEIR